MGWRDLLQADHESVVSPWVGGRSLRTFDRVWTIEGDLPTDHGWHAFAVRARRARWTGARDDVPSGTLRDFVGGYLVGDRLIADGVRVTPDPAMLCAQSEGVHLLPDGIDRFARIRAGRAFQGGPLVYHEPEMPLGPESDVLAAFLDRAESVQGIRGVAPALDAAFRIECWRRSRAEQRRREELARMERQAQLARERQEREQREARDHQQREERRRRAMDCIGSAPSRRQLAQLDFGEAARVSLAMGGATYLDHRRISRSGEIAVRFRLNGRSFECTCQEQSFRIIDAGICLTDERTGERGDAMLTLESLPAVIAEASRAGRLVVFRHV